MFDIGLPELLLVSTVALIVIGPERLPETVRTLMLWLGRIRKSFASIKSEIEQEIGADEIRQQLHNESIMKELDQAREQIQEVIHTTGNSLHDLKQRTVKSLDAATEIVAAEENKNTQALDKQPAAIDSSKSAVGNQPGNQELDSDRPKQSESGD